MRCFPRSLRFWTAALLVAWLGLLDVAPAAAGLMPSRTTGTTGVANVRDADRMEVQRALEHRVVAQKLRDYGVTPDQVEARLASLSDVELHQLASATRGLPSGSDGLGSLIAVLIIVLLVVLIVKLLNKEIVIK